MGGALFQLFFLSLVAGHELIPPNQRMVILPVLEFSFIFLNSSSCILGRLGFGME